MTRADKAKQYFLNGYNCAQAVAMAFADLMDMDEYTAARLTSGFGGGVGRMREVCGSVSGMAFVMSSLYGYGDAAETENKKQLYGEIQQLAEEFRAQNGSIVCRELLGLSHKGPDSPVPEPRTAQYYQKRPCHELVRCSADILERYIESRQTASE